MEGNSSKKEGHWLPWGSKLPIDREVSFKGGKPPQREPATVSYTERGSKKGFESANVGSRNIRPEKSRRQEKKKRVDEKGVRPRREKNVGAAQEEGHPGARRPKKGET